MEYIQPTMPKINLSNVKELVPLDEGEYEAELEAWELVEPKDTKKFAYIKCTFVCTDGDNEGRKLFRNLSTSPNALWAMKRALIRMGADETDLLDEDGFDPEDVMPDLIGNAVLLKVVQREYDGDIVNDVKDIREALAV